MEETKRCLDEAIGGKKKQAKIASLFAYSSAKEPIEIDDSVGGPSDLNVQVASSSAGVQRAAAAEPGPTAAPSAPKKGRFVLLPNDPVFDTFEFREEKDDSGKTQKMMRCQLCACARTATDKEKAWSVYKQDSVLKHVGLKFGESGLIPRTDGNTGRRHQRRVEEQSQAAMATGGT